MSQRDVGARHKQQSGAAAPFVRQSRHSVWRAVQVEAGPDRGQPGLRTAPPGLPACTGAGAIAREPTQATAAAAQIDVWTWRLTAQGKRLAALARWLSADERARAARFVAEPDQTRFVIGRARLRQVLARYVDRPPQDLVFGYGEHGKPALVQCHDAPAFNLSHSGEHMVIAVAPHGDVGIDIERIRPIEPSMARRFFSEAESTALSQLSGQAWLAAFFRCWTRKEALLKAAGKGLFSGMAVTQAWPATVAGVGPTSAASDAAATAWTVIDLALGEGLAGAIATRRVRTGTGVRHITSTTTRLS
jgi:4'-phosphopantetheinyl transferase